MLLNHRGNAGGLALIALVLTACGSGASTVAHQATVHSTTATSASLVSTPPSSTAIASNSKAEVSSGHPKAVPRTTAARTTVAAPKPKLAVAPTRTTTTKPAVAAGLCGAPANPFGYSFCGGQVITAPDPAVCNYFSCIPNFPNGKGYMEQCRDGMYSMSGGRSGACSYHDGENQPVLKR